ncbi:MAG: tRNA (adenosine(37)-N6)-threonylcarbamoyltransferase complex dimerization subunit type 1 TsaB [Clostridia bacterium]|nr:tRNA (adenosine(37)-N6)-threonylcarbamoyltransferase complex dimerization subunit type 1 TsaB [Clostridia bacterium]
MKTLCVDTTSDNMAVAVTTDDSIFTALNREGRGSTSANIISCIDSALNNASLRLKDMDYIGAVVGPGSFTGIRIGISVINAFHLALNIPLISISVFDVLSADFEANALCIIDARHSCYYGAQYNCGQLSEQREYTLDEVAAFKGSVIVRGKYKNLEGFDNIISLDDAAYSDKLARVMLKKSKEKATVIYLIPLYMKLSQAERNSKD